MNEYIAHEGQSVRDHLLGVAKLAGKNAEKIGCLDYGKALGLLHDLGKYSSAFQEYIKTALGQLDPDTDEESVDVKSLKGKIDHSSAGAQLLWREVSPESSSELVLAQMLALCLASHHSGLIDCLTFDLQGTFDVFSRRINKKDKKTHLSEVVLCAEGLDEIRQIIGKKDFARPFENLLKNITSVR